MSLSIKNPSLEQRVRELASIMGVGAIEAIDVAVREKLARAGLASVQEQAKKAAALRAIRERYGPFAPLDRQAIEDEMYDDHGIAR